MNPNSSCSVSTLSVTTYWECGGGGSYVRWELHVSFKAKLGLWIHSFRKGPTIKRGSYQTKKIHVQDSKQDSHENNNNKTQKTARYSLPLTLS